MGVGPGRNGGLFDIWESKNFKFFQTRKYSKNVKIINEKIKIFAKILRKISIFWRLLKILSKI